MDEKTYSTPMAPSSMEDASNCVLIEGYLQKKSRYLRRWRNRWMVMTQHRLCSYKNPNDFSKATESIELYKVKSITIDQDSFDKTKNAKLNQKYIFIITIDNDKESPYNPTGEQGDGTTTNENNEKEKENITLFSFSANNEKECQLWIKQFERILMLNKTLLILPSQIKTKKRSLNPLNGNNNNNYNSYNHSNNNNGNSNNKLLTESKHDSFNSNHSNNSNTSNNNNGGTLGYSNHNHSGNGNNNDNDNDNNNNNLSNDRSNHNHNSNDNNNHNNNNYYHYNEETVLIPSYGCQHYRRNCYIKSDCCKNWYFCSYCHDLNEDTLDISNIIKALRNDNEKIESHTLDRSKIHWMTCVHCGKEQQISNYCINPKCGIQMAKYYCGKCKFWNNDANCKLFHCDGCGVCRTGNKNDYTHCYKCGVCLTKAYYARHKCIEQATQCDCPICGDFLHRSDKPVTFWPNCGHGIHVDCMNEYLKFDSLCSVCRTPWVPDLTNLNINYINTY